MKQWHILVREVFSSTQYSPFSLAFVKFFRILSMEGGGSDIDEDS